MDTPFDHTLKKLYRDAIQLRVKIVTIEFLIMTFLSEADYVFRETMSEQNIDIIALRQRLYKQIKNTGRFFPVDENPSNMDISTGLSAVLNWCKAITKNTSITDINAATVLFMILAWGDAQRKLLGDDVLTSENPDLFVYSILNENNVNQELLIKNIVRLHLGHLRDNDEAPQENLQEYEEKVTNELKSIYKSAQDSIYLKSRNDQNEPNKAVDGAHRTRPEGLMKKREHDEKRGDSDSDSQFKFEDFTINLNEKAKQSGSEPLIGRTEEIDRCVQVLCKKRKNNPLFIGEPGVGKTALAEGLAQRIVDGKVPEKLKDSIVYSLQITDVLAGTKYRGDFEERMKVIIKTASELPNAILFIDEIHTLVGAGATTNSTLDASNMMKPALASGAIRCIGATTYQEYKKYFEKDKALSRRFHTIDVPEPSIEETIKILNGVKDIYEKFHNVNYSPESIKAAATLSAKYINDRFLPDKAIDILDEVGAKSQTQDAQAGQGPRKINKAHIESIISSIARIPLTTVTQTEKDQLKNLESALRTKIYGQDEAVKSVVETVKLSKSGLADPNKPLGSFLFAGPTGVGKTELCKQLADHLGLKLLRFDMSEYSDSISVNKLIGVAPGYVGFDQLGLLTDKVQNNPHSILLLDELEKAHQDIYNVLLQVLDYGTLTDNNGRKVDFRHVIIVMTTNVGADALDSRSLGFTFDPSDIKDCHESVKKFFPPEFRNRIDHIVYFNPLSRETVRSIVVKLLDELQQSVKEKKINLTFNSKLIDHLIDIGYDPKMGARPLKRTIKDHILNKLSDEMLFGNLVKGGDTEISVNDKDEVVLLFKRKRVKKASSTKESAPEKQLLD